MGILRNVERIFDPLVCALRDVLGQSDRRILVRTHIHDVVVALILHRATRIESLDSLVGFHKVVSRTCLVTQTPNAH